MMPDTTPTPRVEPCALTPEAPTPIVPGAVSRVALRPSRIDVVVRPMTWPLAVEAEVVDGPALQVKAGLELEDERFDVDLEWTCAGETRYQRVTFQVARTVRWGSALTWSATAGPTPREHPALFIDPAEPDVLWLYGGYGFDPRPYTVLDDLWRLDLRSNGWTKVETMGAPLIAGGRLVAGQRPGEVLLIGGQLANDDVVGTVHRFDLKQRPVRVEALPIDGVAPKLTLAGAFREGARVVTFGGFTGDDVSDEVSSFALDAPTPRWSSTRSPGPSARYGFFFAVDGERALVFSGGQRPRPGDGVNAADDVWALSLRSLAWTKVADGARAAPGRRNGCGGFDPVRRRFFVWSGTPDGATAVESVSMLDLAATPVAWTKLGLPSPPTGRGSCAGVYDAPRRRLLLGFGNTLTQRFADLQVLELGP